MPARDQVPPMPPDRRRRRPLRAPRTAVNGMASDPRSSPVPSRRPGLREAGAALKIPDFRRFWIGALASNSGSWMQNVTVPFALYELTESPAWVGLASFMQFVPAVILGPLGGSLADRFPRRNILLATMTSQGVVAAALWALWSSGSAEPWSLVVLVACFGAVSGLGIGAWQAFVSELVPRRLLLNAVTLNSAQFNAARAVGPALGGVVLAAFGPSGAFAINAVSYLAVLAALVRIAPRPSASAGAERPSLLGETWDTAKYLRRMPGIWACVRVIVAVGFLGSPVFPFIVVFAEEVFTVEGFLYGLLAAGLGIGGVLATPYVAGRGTAHPRSVLARWGLAIYAVSLVVFATAPVYALAMVALVVAGGAYLTIASTLNTTIQVQVDEERRGKVLSLYVMGLTTSYPLGSLVQGAIADQIGVRAVTAGAGVALFGVWTVLRARRHFCAMDDDPQGAHRYADDSTAAPPRRADDAAAGDQRRS